MARFVAPEGWSVNPARPARHKFVVVLYSSNQRSRWKGRHDLVDAQMFVTAGARVSPGWQFERSVWRGVQVASHRARGQWIDRSAADRKHTRSITMPPIAVEPKRVTIVAVAADAELAVKAGRIGFAVEPHDQKTTRGDGRAGWEDKLSRRTQTVAKTPIADIDRR